MHRLKPAPTDVFLHSPEGWDVYNEPAVRLSALAHPGHPTGIPPDQDPAYAMYTSYFGFDKQPFTGSDLQVFMAHPAVDSALACLRRGLAERRGSVLLCGESGTGKSTLLRRLMADLEPRADCVLIWNAHLDFDGLLGYVCDRLGVKPNSAERKARLAALEEHLLRRLTGDRDVILVLDDAHNLDDATLAELPRLLAMRTAGQPLLPMLLSCQPALETRLDACPELAALNRALSHRCRLEPLDDASVVRYVRERLKAAGYTGDELFEPEALDKLVAHAKGLPRLINLICNQALLLAYLNSEQRISPRLIRTVAADSRLPEAPRPAPTAPPIQPEPTDPSPLAAAPDPFDKLAATQPRTRPEPAPTFEKASEPDAAMDPEPMESAATGREPFPAQRPRQGRLYPERIEPGMAASHRLSAPPLGRAQAPRRRPRSRRRFWIGALALLAVLGGSTALATRYLDLPPEFQQWVRAGSRTLQEFMDKIQHPGQEPNEAASAPDRDGQPKQVTPSTALATSPAPGATQTLSPVPETPSRTPPPVTETPSQAVAIESAPPAETGLTEPPAPTPTLPNPDRVAALLEQSEAQRQALRYTFPAGDNALETYRQILALDPGNTQALAGIAAIKADFIRWSETARSRGNLAKAQRHLETALRVDPSDSELRQRLEQLRR